MEELRSTEILDREIQDDARRKAEKLLKACDAECRKLLDEVGPRTELTRTEKEAEYRLRLDSHIRDVQSAIPLEKQRFLVSFIDESVGKALDAWFEGIGPERRLSLYAARLARYRNPLEGKTVNVLCAGYPAGQVRKIAEATFGSGRVAAVTELSSASSSSAGFSDGIRIEASDGSVACRATLEELRDELLGEKRQELAEALLGGRLPE